MKEEEDPKSNDVTHRQVPFLLEGTSGNGKIDKRYDQLELYLRITAETNWLEF